MGSRDRPTDRYDPNNRILVSQALFEEMLLLSAYPRISRYPGEVV
jgi:PIN domain nuclease of toxin-antitoxin system